MQFLEATRLIFAGLSGYYRGCSSTCEQLINCLTNRLTFGVSTHRRTWRQPEPRKLQLIFGAHLYCLVLDAPVVFVPVLTI